MPDIRFTDKRIRSLRPPSRGKRAEYADGGRPGLRLRVYSDGRKTWLYRQPRVRGANGDARRPGVTFAVYPGSSAKADRLPEMGCNAAIREYEIMRGETRDVRSLRHEIEEAERRLEELRSQAGHGIRVGELVEKYRRHLEKDEDCKRPDIAEGVLQRFLVQPYGSKAAASITRRTISEIVDGEVARGNRAQARKAFFTIKALFRFALQRDLVPEDPTPGVEVPKRTPPSKDVNRPLADSELASLLAFFDAELRQSMEFKRYPRFAWHGTVRCLLDVLYTGERRAAVAATQWEWIIGDGWWRVPAEKAKKTKATPRDHSLWRGPDAMKNVLAMKGAHPVLVFPTQSGKTDFRAITNVMTIASRALEEHGLFKGPATVHSLRSTMITWLMRQMVDERIVKAMIHHEIFEGAIQTYAHPEYRDPCREAWKAWQDHVTGLHRMSSLQGT